MAGTWCGPAQTPALPLPAELGAQASWPFPALATHWAPSWVCRERVPSLAQARIPEGSRPPAGLPTEVAEHTPQAVVWAAEGWGCGPTTFAPRGSPGPGADLALSGCLPLCPRLAKPGRDGQCGCSEGHGESAHRWPSSWEARCEVTSRVGSVP